MTNEILEREPFKGLLKKTKELCDEGLELIRKELLHTVQVKTIDEAAEKLGEQVVLEIEKKSSLEKAFKDTDSEDRAELAAKIGKELIASHEMSLLDQLTDRMGDILVDYIDDVLENDEFFEETEDYDSIPAMNLAKKYGNNVRQEIH